MKQFIILILFSNSIYSQDIFLGPKFGSNLTIQKTIYKNSKYTSADFGNDIGFVFDMNITNNFSLLFEPSIKTINFNYETSPNYVENNVSLTSLNIPLIARFKLGDKIQPFFDLGIYYSTQMSIDTLIQSKFDYPKINPINSGLIYGIGLEGSISPKTKTGFVFRNILYPNSKFYLDNQISCQFNTILLSLFMKFKL